MASIPTGGPPQLSPAPPVIDQGIIPIAQSIAIDDEPPSKKLRSEDNLIPEAEFIAVHKVKRPNMLYLFHVNNTFILLQSPITIQVQIPKWKLNGQTIAVSLALMDPVFSFEREKRCSQGAP